MKTLVFSLVLVTSLSSVASEMDNRLSHMIRIKKSFSMSALKLNGKTLVLGKNQKKNEAAEVACLTLGFSSVETVEFSRNYNCPEGACYSLIKKDNLNEIVSENETDETTYTELTVPFKIVGGLFVAAFTGQNSIPGDFAEGTTFGGAKAISSLTCSKLAD